MERVDYFPSRKSKPLRKSDLVLNCNYSHLNANKESFSMKLTLRMFNSIYLTLD